jgi:hypothetical protein
MREPELPSRLSVEIGKPLEMSSTPQNQDDSKQDGDDRYHDHDSPDRESNPGQSNGSLVDHPLQVPVSSRAHLSVSILSSHNLGSIEKSDC